LERAVALRDPLPEPAEPSGDRSGWVVALGKALNNLSPALSEDEADLLVSHLDGDLSVVLIQLGQLRGAVASAKQRKAGRVL
jgi:hypothetical protein